MAWTYNKLYRTWIVKWSATTNKNKAYRANSKPHGKYDKTIADIIEEKLRLTWSPEQIAKTTTFGKEVSKLFITGCIKVNFP